MPEENSCSYKVFNSGDWPRGVFAFTGSLPRGTAAGDIRTDAKSGVESVLVSGPSDSMSGLEWRWLPVYEKEANVDGQ